MFVIILVIKQANTRSLYVTIAWMPVRRLQMARESWRSGSRAEATQLVTTRKFFATLGRDAPI